MTRRFRFMLISLLSMAVPAASSLCEDVAWGRLAEAMVQGNEGVIAELVGSGRLSLRLDGISQGRYTAQQARQLLGGFFSKTEKRSLSYGSCNSSGVRAWAEATYRYKESNTGRFREERLLLEWFAQGKDELLSGIRSVSVGSTDAPPRDAGKE